MKSFVFEGPGNIVVKDVPKPKPREGELLLKPLYVGLCFSELNGYLNPKWLSMRPGMILGHEGSAEVAEIGPGVEGWKVGERVAINPMYDSCGECLMCRAGWPYRCQRPKGWYPGLTAEYDVAPAGACWKVPAEVSDLAAANVEHITVGTRAIRHSGMTIGDNVVILGADDYALGTLQWAKLGGARQIIMCDPYKVRRDVAKKLGADLVFDPTTEPKAGGGIKLGMLDPTEKAKALAEYGPFKLIKEQMPFGADFVFVSIENYIKQSMDYFRQAIEMVRTQGTVGVIRGYYGEDGWPRFGGGLAWIREISIRHFGIFFGDEPWRGGRERGDYALTIEEMARGRIKGEGPVTRVIPFDEVNSKEDLDAIYQSLPESDVKIYFRIWGK